MRRVLGLVVAGDIMGVVVASNLDGRAAGLPSADGWQAFTGWAEAEGLIVRVEGNRLDAPLVLGWAYGGASGERGKRDGDIGTEHVPIGEYFQFTSENAREQSFTLSADAAFTLKTKSSTLRGLTLPMSKLAVLDAAAWASPFTTPPPVAPPAEPIVAGRVTLTNTNPVYLWVQRLSDAAPSPADGPGGAHRETAPARTNVYVGVVEGALVSTSSHQGETRVRLKT